MISDRDLQRPKHCFQQRSHFDCMFTCIEKRRRPWHTGVLGQSSFGRCSKINLSCRCTAKSCLDSWCVMLAQPFQLHVWEKFFLEIQ